MKVEIESDILGTEKEISEINYILHLAFNHFTLKEFEKDIKQTEFYTLEYGFGSNHCWVKQYVQNDELKYNLRNDRLLIINP